MKHGSRFVVRDARSQASQRIKWPLLLARIVMHASLAAMLQSPCLRLRRICSIRQVPCTGQQASIIVHHAPQPTMHTSRSKMRAPPVTPHG